MNFMTPNIDPNTLSSARLQTSSSRRQLLRGTLAMGAVVSLVMLGSAACGLISTNILDKTFELSPQKFSLDFGTTTGKVPSVACTVAGDPKCATLASQVSAAGGTATGTCDTVAKSCGADITVTKSYPVTLSNEPSFAQTVGGKAISIVKAIELNYGASNQSTVNLPDMNLYIGPDTAKSPTDKDVYLIDKIPAIAKGTVIPDKSRKIVVQAGSPAFDRFSYYLQNPKVPFLLLISGKPSVKAGDDLPSGKVDVTITPAFTVGLPL